MDTPASSLPFTDVPANQWYAGAVRFVYDRGMMGGTTATTFSPKGYASRAQLVVVLYQLEGAPEVSGNLRFTDVSPKAYYAKAVNWAADNQIVSGTSATTFSPTSPVTREQMITILRQYAMYRGYNYSVKASLEEFVDLGRIEKYALTPMRWGKATGLMGGTTATTISPKGKITRAEMAVVLMQFCNKVVGTVNDPNADARIPVEFKIGGETVYTVYLPEEWDGDYVVRITNSPSAFGSRGSAIRLGIYDKRNYNRGIQEYGSPIGHLLSFYLFTNPTGELHFGSGLRKTLNVIRFQNKEYTLVYGGPTDVNYFYELPEYAASYQSKTSNLSKVVDSLVFSNAVTVIS